MSATIKASSAKCFSAKPRRGPAIQSLVPCCTTVQNLRASSHVTGRDGAAVSSHSARSLRFGTGKGPVAAVGSELVVRRAPRDSRSLHPPPHLCFPCKVWGFSKQTGGDKHMLRTALCWVASEVQRSRSLSGCGYTSHSEVDGKTGALLFTPLVINLRWTTMEPR